MVLPHYLGRSKDIDIERKISEYNPEEINRQDSFSPQTPPDDIPLLLPHEANDSDSSTMENKVKGFNSGKYYSTELSRHRTGSSYPYHDLPRTRYSFIDNDHSADLPSATLEAITESDLRAKDEWLETQEQTCDVISTDEVTDVGPRALCQCQVSYKDMSYRGFVYNYSTIQIV